MEKYSVINFKNLDWYVIDIDEINGTTRLLLKDVLDEARIKKYVDDEWYRNGSCVRHTYDVRPPFNWDNSYIKNVVLPNFVKDLGIECEVTLLTKDEVESLPDDIRRCNDWWWTKTNASDETDKYAYAFFVNYYGYVYYYNYVLSEHASLRPAVSVASSALVEDEEKNKKDESTCDSEETMVCGSKKGVGKNLFDGFEKVVFQKLEKSLLEEHPEFVDAVNNELEKINNKVDAIIDKLKGE